VISVSLHRRDLHARTTDGHFVSVDGGASWVGIGSGPPEGTMVWDYTISEYQVFARNADGEAWRRPR
jgi:hypothetical protein